jgi:hypothetical protein
LDWTESPLIALFFACLDGTDLTDDRHAGAVWRLHSNAVRFGLEAEEDDLTNVPPEVAMPRIPTNTPNALNGTFDAFLFYPPRLHARQINQLGAYTVHPNPPSSESTDFAEFHRPEDILTRYVIPGTIKRETLAKLYWHPTEKSDRKQYNKQIEIRAYGENARNQVHKIQRLEELLSRRLFVRTTKPLELTLDGEVVLG